MHFTIVFESHESSDLSYGLVFIPCPVWMKGGQELINLHPQNPNYERGDLTPLLNKERVKSKIAKGIKNAVVIIHNTGHGTEKHLSNICADLKESGFAVQQIKFGQTQI